MDLTVYQSGSPEGLLQRSSKAGLCGKLCTVSFIKKCILWEVSPPVFPGFDNLAGCSYIENQLSLSRHALESWATEAWFAQV